jgi:DNA-binding transcriptional ArsR family regulator
VRERPEPSAAVFAALADPTRRRILGWLAGGGPATATQLAPRLPMTRQAVVKHLAALTGAGLTVAQRDGREMRYRLRAEPMTDAMQWMAALAAKWDERLEGLRVHVGSHSPSDQRRPDPRRRGPSRA